MEAHQEAKLRRPVAIAVLGAILGIQAFWHAPASKAQGTNGHSVYECPTDSWFHLEDGMARYCGPIDDYLLEEIEAAISEIDEFSLATMGGGSHEAQQIVDILNDNDVHIILHHACISACAHFIFMAAESVFVADDTLIGFHHSGHSTALRILAHGVDKDKFQRYILPQAKRDLRFYQDRGLPDDILYVPDLELEPICIDGPLMWDWGNNARLFFPNEYDLWIPTNRRAATLNDNAEFASIEHDMDAISENAATVFPKISNFKLKVATRIAARSHLELTEIRRCDDFEFVTSE